jgi:uncharacterized protein YlaI
VLVNTKCSLCGKEKKLIKCGDTDKHLTKKSKQLRSEYICAECKKRGTGEYSNSSDNHKQSEIYETMED